MWRSILSFIVIVALTISFPAAGNAQTELLPGDQLRVLAHDGTTVTGTIVAASPEMIVLDSSGGERQIDFADIALLERSSEHHRKFGDIFLTTVGVGGGLGGVISAAIWSPCNSTGFLDCLFVPESRLGAFGQGFMIGGIVAIPVGLIVGLSLKHDRWEPISLPALPALPASTISIRPEFTEGIGLSASISF